MNRLNTAKRAQVIAALVEGVSINATSRMTGVAKHTVLNLGILRSEGDERHCRAENPGMGRRLDLDGDRR
jgi:hypothetical protein